MRIAALALWALPVAADAQDYLAPGGAKLSLMDAVAAAASRHPGVRIQEEQISAAKGAVRVERGAFDRRMTAGASQIRSNNPLTSLQRRSVGGVDNNAINLTNFGLNTQQLFANGMSFGPTAELNRTADNISNVFGLNRSRVGLRLDMPLIRGRGREVVQAGLRSAEISVESEQFGLTQALTDRIADAASTYWNYVAALRSLQVLEGSEDRGRKFLENVEALIQAGVKPRGDRDNMAANFADRSATRVGAQQRMIEARQQLALSMGLSEREVHYLAPPSDDFPPVADLLPPVIDPEGVQRFAEVAAAQRGDYLSANRRIGELQALLPAALNGVRPRVDLNFFAGYSGLNEGRYPDSFFASPLTRIRGMDVSAGLSYDFAPANNAAKGRVSQLQAAIRQAEWQRYEIKRSIAANLVAALEGVRNSIQRIERANASVEAFQNALEGEKEKLRLGFGSLVDILLIEDRLTNALLGQVQSRQSYAVSLTRLRSVSGSIVPAGATNAIDLQRETLITLPPQMIPLLAQANNSGKEQSQ
jgi:outer membrane protein